MSRNLSSKDQWTIEGGRGEGPDSLRTRRIAREIEQMTFYGRLHLKHATRSHAKGSEMTPSLKPPSEFLFSIHDTTTACRPYWRWKVRRTWNPVPWCLQVAGQYFRTHNSSFVTWRWDNMNYPCYQIQSNPDHPYIISDSEEEDRSLSEGISKASAALPLRMDRKLEGGSRTPSAGSSSRSITNRSGSRPTIKQRVTDSPKPPTTSQDDFNGGDSDDEFLSVDIQRNVSILPTVSAAWGLNVVFHSGSPLLGILVFRWMRMRIWNLWAMQLSL